MNKADFLHCHCHSSNSMLDGLGQPEEHVIRAKKLGFKYYTLTEHGNIDSLIKFQKACKKHDIKGIKGSELYEFRWTSKKMGGDVYLKYCLKMKNST